MSGIIAIIHPTAREIPHAIVEPSPTPPTLIQLQAAVKGYIEAVPLFITCRPLFRSASRCVAFCNEDGKSLNLPENVLATRLWHSIAPQMSHDILCGTVVILTGSDDFMDSL